MTSRTWIAIIAVAALTVLALVVIVALTLSSTSTPTETPTATADSTPSPTLEGTPTVTTPPNGTPTPGETASPPPAGTPTNTPVEAGHPLISEVFYDTPGSEADEQYIEIYNPSGSPVDLSGYKLGDGETPGGTEGMFQFPAGASIGAGERIAVALKAAGFFALFGFLPDYEIIDTDASVQDMTEYSPWSGGEIALADTGDEVLLIGPDDAPVDVVTYEQGTYPGVTAHPGVDAGHSIERSPADQDTNDCSVDFVDRSTPTPGT
jgi:hypothetical protein